MQILTEGVAELVAKLAKENNVGYVRTALFG